MTTATTSLKLCVPLLGIMLLIDAGHCFAGDSATKPAGRDERKFSDTAATTAAERRAAIVKAVAQADPDSWAGEYDYGDGLGVNVSLALAPNQGFVFQWTGCMGVYDRNWGEVSETDGVVSLKCELPNQRQGFQGISTRLRPVKWGERHYLIGEEDLVRFCNRVNSGTEAKAGRRSSMFLLRRGDEAKAVQGKPELPAEYQKLLLDEPVKATITAVEGDKLTIDIGAAHGAFQDMELFKDSPGEVESIKITKVGDKTSEAEVVNVIGRRSKAGTDWKLTSRAPWAR
ncbi:MAG TPA: hypothetical protein VF669_18395 [Tepidisphaeraceae bacterium]